jgi:hypothetical protein
MPLPATLRQSRQVWAGLLLGVLLALLPLRGWAEVAMHLSAPVPQSSAAEAPMPPCHAAMTGLDGTAPDESASGCSLCSLCHGSALLLGETGNADSAAGATAGAAVSEGHGPPALPLPERPPRA